MFDDLQLLIKPASADCNQACTYCFYRRVGRLYSGHGAHRMPEETLRRMVSRYLKLRLPQSVFCWQGGEPALAGLDFFRLAVQLMQQHGARGQSVSNAFQTNGLLLDRDWCDFFRKYGFLVGVSLDGPAEIHDAYRRLSGGEGSHTAVLRCVHLLRQREVEFNVLSVVTDLAARHAKRTYAYLREIGVTHMQFIPCVERDFIQGTASSFSVGPEAYGEFLCEIFDAWLPEAHQGISVRLFDGLVRRGLCGDTGLCDLDGPACGHCPVVEWNGDVYPCDFFVEEQWRLGSVHTMSFEKIADRGRARLFRQARCALPGACAACDWKDLCRGGCLKDRHRAGGRFDVPTWFCAAWRRFLPHAAEPVRRIAETLRASATESA